MKTDMELAICKDCVFYAMYCELKLCRIAIDYAKQRGVPVVNGILQMNTDAEKKGAKDKK
jgi:hypothetical protein